MACGGGGEGFSPPPPPPPPTPPLPTLVSPLPHLCGSLYLNWPQLPADRPCVQDRQRDDASWFNYVYNIALFLINSSSSLIAITLGGGGGGGGGESLIFEAASYCLLLLIDCGRTRNLYYLQYHFKISAQAKPAGA